MSARAVERLRSLYPQLALVHAPVHASWLNQIEIYFSIVQRKVLSPNDFVGLDPLAERLLDFQYYRESTARPFEWKFTRQDLTDLLTKNIAFPCTSFPAIENTAFSLCTLFTAQTEHTNPRLVPLRNVTRPKAICPATVRVAVPYPMQHFMHVG